MITRIILALALTGCYVNHTPTDPDVYHADTAFTYSERMAIDEGARYLGDHTGHNFVIVYDMTTEETHAIHRGRTPDQPENSSGYFDGTANNIFLDMAVVHQADKDFPTFVAAAAAHEFGHAIGMSHHEGAGIMNATPESLTWTTEDQENDHF